LVAVLVAVPASATATDLHTLFDGRCRRTTGILVYVGADTVSMVDLGGAYVVRARGDIDGIAVHKTLENPLAQIALAGGLRDHLRDVWVDDDARPTFTGWTTAFFDDLFLYFDLEGQTHVLDPEEIQRIRPTANGAREVRPKSHAAVQLAFPSEVVPCGAAGAIAADAVLPSRVIADRIKVGDYLGKLEQRYLAQSGFEERTYVYAEPFVFDPQNRLGLIYDPEWQVPLPLYFRWSNGRPYRFQSLSSIGNATHEWLPHLFPSISVRSDIKSHFFNGTFVGNLLSLPAGTDSFLLDEISPEEDAEKLDVAHSYNYLLLMGADLWRVSASIGASYLSTRISVPMSVPRKVLATSLSPTVRLRYQGADLQLRALYYRTRASAPLGDLFPDEGGFEEDEELREENYHWRLDTVRLGATWRPHPTIELLLDQIGSRGAFRDDWSENPVALTMWELATGGEVAVTFGRYVTVRGNARFYYKRYKITRPMADEETSVGPRFGGALEFVF
jgi:hypothetical protein